MKQLTRILSLAIILSAAISCTEVITDFEPVSQTEQPSDSALLPHAAASDMYDTLSPIPRKCIYLTIDDAPLNGSVYIDSIVSKTKVKTNIFMVGNPIDGSGKFKKYYNMLRGNQYIEIYNHSYSHANNKYAAYYKSPESVLADFEKNSSDFGISHRIARLPGRNLWKIGEKTKNYKQTGATSAQLLSDNGYKIFGWDVEWKYNARDCTPKQTIDELLEEIKDACEKSATFSKNHLVLLMHDQMFAAMNGENDLDILINKLKDENFSFEYLSSYPE